jgi:hypothetical protein
MSDEREQVGSVSRRTALKTIGAGAVVAWAAPTLTSIDKAYAQQGSPTALGCPECDVNDLCSGQGFCSADESTCPCSPMLDRETCFCWQGPHGGCDSFFGRCDPALGNVDCAAGQTCVPTCCYSGGKTGVCMVPCGQPGAGASGSVAGPRTDGR